MAIWETGCPEMEASARARYQYSSEWRVIDQASSSIRRDKEVDLGTGEDSSEREKNRSDVKRRGFSHKNSISGSLS